MVLLFLFLMSGVLVINDTETEFLLSVDSFLNNPKNVFVLDEYTLLVDDPGAPYPLYQIDLKTREITNRIRNGQGPGELGQMYKTITFPDDETIAVFDREQMRLHLYDRRLQHIRTESGSLFRESPMQLGFLNPELVFMIPSDSDVIRLYQNSEDRFAENLTRSINRDDDEKFSSLENFLLKQDVHFTQFDGTIYTTFGYSSLLMVIDEEGLRYTTFGPENYHFPEPEDPESGRFALPAIDEYPIGALDIDTDEEYVYILYSGQKIEVDRISEFSGPDAYIEEIRNSRRVMKFHREDGSFAGEKELPRSVSGFKVNGDRMYLYTTKGEDSPTLYVYEKNF